MVQASHWGGFSCCWAHGFRAWQWLWYTGLVAPWLVESSWIQRSNPWVPWSWQADQILNYRTIRSCSNNYLLNAFRKLLWFCSVLLLAVLTSHSYASSNKKSLLYPLPCQHCPLMSNWSWALRDKMNIFSAGWAIKYIFLESRNGGESTAGTLRQWLGTGLMAHWSLDSMAYGDRHPTPGTPRPDCFVGLFFVLMWCSVFSDVHFTRNRNPKVTLSCFWFEHYQNVHENK